MGELIPDENFIVSHENYNEKSYEGWAYAAHTADQQIFLAYFEKGCPRSLVRGVIPFGKYRARWFDPRDGARSDVGSGELKADVIGEIVLPDFPSDMDWGKRWHREGARRAKAPNACGDCNGHRQNVYTRGRNLPAHKISRGKGFCSLWTDLRSRYKP